MSAGRWLLSVAALLVCGACASSRGPYGSGEAHQRNIRAADEIYHQAVTQMAHDAVAAERLLRQCLDFDLYHGPAHNNLGVILLRQGHLYQASEEFEWAKKLLPGNPEPRVNLAIALEQGGCLDQAAAAARSALEVRPGNLPALEMLTRIQLRDGTADESTAGNLGVIALESADPVWRSWAAFQRERLQARAHSD